MKKIILSIFGFSVIVFSGCAQKELSCQKNQIQEGQKCVPFSLKKTGVITAISCIDADATAGDCKEQKVELSMDNATVVEHSVKNGKYQIGDILEIYIKE